MSQAEGRFVLSILIDCVELFDMNRRREPSQNEKVCLHANVTNLTITLYKCVGVYEGIAGGIRR